MSTVSSTSSSSGYTTYNLRNMNRTYGLASGLDIDSLVSKLMKAASAPLDTLNQQKQLLEWKQEDYRTINTSLAGLRDAVLNMKLQRTYLAMKASSSDSGIVTAAAANNASAVSYQVTVHNLATAATNASTGAIASSSFDPSKTLISQTEYLTNGTDADFAWDENHQFSFTINGQSFTFDADTDSLNSVITTINKNSAAGVTAFYDLSTRKISLSSTSTGANSRIQVSGAFATNVLMIDNSKVQAGQDATFDLNGLTGITSQTNSYTVNGTTLNFTGADSGKTVTVSVTSDIDSVVDAIKDFVSKYNDTLEAINSKLSEKRYSDYKPLTDDEISGNKMTDTQVDQWQAKARSGLLQNDSLLLSVVSNMRNAMSSVVSGLTGKVSVTVGSQQITAVASQMSVIGITTSSYEAGSSDNGKLILDEDRLREALQSNPQAVMDLFTKSFDSSGKQITDSCQQGLTVRLYNTLNNSISQIADMAGSSSDLYDNSYIGQETREINQRISDMNDYLKELENRYYDQFDAMEEAISKLNAQSAWLSAQFSSTSS